jgi:hypothetical protein
MERKKYNVLLLVNNAPCYKATNLSIVRLDLNSCLLTALVLHSLWMLALSGVSKHTTSDTR